MKELCILFSIKRDLSGNYYHLIERIIKYINASAEKGMSGYGENWNLQVSSISM